MRSLTGETWLPSELTSKLGLSQLHGTISATTHE
jgi:hypothetical protein